MIRRKKLYKSLLPLALFIIGYVNCFGQDAYMNLADTNSNGLFRNFIGIKLFAADFGATSLNQDLQFQYTSNNTGAVYNFKHDMNVTGLKGFYNLGLGLEENLGKHLVLNFFNASIGTIQHMWDWNVGAGAGYFVSLNKQHSMRLNATVNVYYECITYGFGDYYDTTGLGFLVDGYNVGTTIKNVKYVNSIWTVSPGIELLYRRSNIDYFAGVYYNYVFSYHEEVNFYEHSIPVSYAIYYPNGAYVPKDIANLGNYIIQIGIVREFGL